MKPIIGIMPLWDETKDSIWMLPGYMDIIQKCGGTPIMFPFSKDEEEVEQLVQLCDGILITGGHDVNPAFYHEQPLDNVICCKERDDLEVLVCKYAISNQKPIFGICRGLQFINTYFNGSLYQDIPSQLPSSIQHAQKPPYDSFCHEVTILENTPLYDTLQISTLPVNSCHHQGIKTLGDGLKPMAISPDGIVEAIYHEQLPISAVQWHPKFSYKTDPNSIKIIESFIKGVNS